MEAVEGRFDGVKPFFNKISIDVGDLAAQLYLREGSPIAELIDERLSA